jgi:phage terminase large subunit GpA-like protein
VILKYFVPCPFCNRLQTLEWEQIKFEDRKDLDRVKRIHEAKRYAYYECKFCKEGTRLRIVLLNNEMLWKLEIYSRKL